MKTARQQVLDYLRVKRVVSTIELSHALHMTPANARHHLNILVSQGLVQLVGKSAAKTRGRPVYLYGLSDQVRGNGLASLCSVLFDELFDALSTEDEARLLGKLAEKLIASAQGQAGADPLASTGARNRQHLTQRLLNAVQLLNLLNYEARWEAHAQGPRLILENCPYRAINNEYPLVCKLDQQLLAKISGAPVEQVAMLATDARGIHYCAFVLSRAQ